MKWITVPAPITPRTYDGKPYISQDEEGTKTEVGDVSFHRYLMIYVVSESSIVKDEQMNTLTRVNKIGRGYEGNKRVRKLDRAFEKCVGGEVVGVEDEDYKLVRKIIEEKEWASAVFGAQFADFEEAWMCASDKRPELPTNGVMKESETHA